MDTELLLSIPSIVGTLVGTVLGAVLTFRFDKKRDKEEEVRRRAAQDREKKQDLYEEILTALANWPISPNLMDYLDLKKIQIELYANDEVCSIYKEFLKDFSTWDWSVSNEKDGREDPNWLSSFKKAENTASKLESAIMDDFKN